MRLRWCRCLRLPVLLHANNQYYLRLTAELYPDIVIKSEKYFNEGADRDE